MLVPSQPSESKARREGPATGTSSRSKREEILRTATAYFGESGYEATKLADVAAAVGIGSTALYHYFESKLHCLYVIIGDALGVFRSDFDRHTT
jgi:AcrR family transcriptional regulator